MENKESLDTLVVLANEHDEKYWKLEESVDLNKAIECWGQVISLAPIRHPDAPSWLDSLSALLHERFQQLGELVDIEKAVEYSNQAVSLTAPGDPDMPRWLQSLGASLHERFQHMGDLADIEQAIELKSQAVSLTLPGDLDKPSRLESLSHSLHERFQQLGNLTDIDQAIEMITMGLSLTPSGHLDKPVRLDSLGASLNERFRRSGELVDLERAIESSNQAIFLTPLGNPNLPRFFCNLSLSLYDRFQRLGDFADIERAIELSTQAVSLTPAGSSDMPRWLDALSSSLNERFLQLGDIADIEQAISLKRQAVSLTPSGNPNKPSRLDSLSASLYDRFKRLGELADMENSIEYSSQAVSLTAPGHLEMPRRLQSLSSSIQERFKKHGNFADMEQVIDLCGQAVSLTPLGDPNMPSRLDLLGTSLHVRFQRLKNLEDIEKAVNLKSQAVSLLAAGHTMLAIRLESLSASLYEKFRELGELVDLEKAIECCGQAVSLTPEGHPRKSFRLKNLGDIYLLGRHSPDSDRFIGQAVDCFQKSSQCLTGRPIDRFWSAVRWATICETYLLPSLIEAYQQCMSLLSRVVWLGSTVDKRYEDIIDVGGISTRAVAAAIEYEEYEKALEWLEEGRSIVWKQMQQLRTPIEDLAVVSPSLASQIQGVADQLNEANVSEPLNTSLSNDASYIEMVNRQHRHLAQRWEELLGQARCLPGFNSFLRPLRASELMGSAQSGPVVMINVHESRCDALVIHPGISEVSHIPLDVSEDDLASLCVDMKQFVHTQGLSDRGVKLVGYCLTKLLTNQQYHYSEVRDSTEIFEETLDVLWEEVVEPVLEHLGYTAPSSEEDLPHITWCIAGPLSFLPLHAAGDYESDSIIFDYVISSYAPTLSSLLPPHVTPTEFSGILAVGQASTPGTSPLPGTTDELDRIQDKSHGLAFTRLESVMATPTAVLAGMETHSWIHMACHAAQNTTHPMQSAFYLHEGTLDLAKITKTQLKHANFAFLSACQTAKGDETLADEAIHLAAGMLTAGYRTVIATMWSIHDEDAPLVADKVYEHLLNGGQPDARRAAIALHEATKSLRDKVGVKAFEKWVPYIHIGL